MGLELGRISGPLLAENLRRDEYLSFQNTEASTPVLYLDVDSGFIGVNTDATNNPLTVLGKTTTTNLVVDTHAETPNFYISTNRIQNLVSTTPIYLQPDQTTDPQIHAPAVGTLNLKISDLLIENITNNSNIELNPSRDTIFTTSKVNVDGNLHSTGNISWGGDVTLGTDDTDNVEFNADISSSLIPDDHDTWDLGTTLKRWAGLYSENLYVSNYAISNILVSTLLVTGTGSFDGNAYIGDDSTDLATFVSHIDNSLIPTLSSYTLGNKTTPLIWNVLFITGVTVDGTIDIRNNTITTLTTDTALELIAHGTGKVWVKFTDVSVANDLNVDGDTSLGNVGITGLLNLPGNFTFDQTGNSDRTGNTSTTTLTVNGENTVQFENIQIAANVITTTVTNSNLELLANGTGIVEVTNTNVQVDNDLDVDLYAYFNSLTTPIDITHPIFTVGDIDIRNNVITTISTDRDLSLQANGTGLVSVPLNNVGITNNLTIDGNTRVNGSTTLNGVYVYDDITQTGNIDQTGDLFVTGEFNSGNIDILTPSYVILPELTLRDSAITVTATDTDLYFTANGTGGVVFDRQLKINTNIISNIFDVNDISLSYNNLYLAEDGQLLITEDGDNYLLDLDNNRDLSVIFEPSGTGNVLIDSTNAIAIPYGNNVDRDLYSIGEIRQNSDTGLYEGWTPDGLVSFSNIYDTDRNTYITPELTPGANDNTLRFFINGSLFSYIDSSKLFSTTLRSDNVNLSGNTISNNISSNNLELVPNGSGSVLVNNVGFDNNTITNTANSALILESTGSGYVKFNGTAGVVIPAGNDTGRRLLPETGEFRYSTSRNYAEIYNGADWVPANGGGAVATEEEIQAETNLWAFILG